MWCVCVSVCGGVYEGVFVGVCGHAAGVYGVGVCVCRECVCGCVCGLCV